MATDRFRHFNPPKLPVEVRLTRLGYVARSTVGWLWPKRVPLGKVTLLVGDPGRGKSLLALDMAARVTRGLPWPDEEEGVEGRGERVEGRMAEEDEGTGTMDEGDTTEAGGQGDTQGTDAAPVTGGDEPDRQQACGAGPGGCSLALPSPLAPLPSPPSAGSVVLLSAEDDAADTIRPRLEAAGGDPDRVIILRSIRKPGSGREGELMFSLAQDLAALEAAIKSGKDARLVILDPVSAYLSGVASHSNAGMRQVLAPLRAVAERTGVAVVAISHLTKRSEASVLYRAMGSLAFVAAARAVWAVGPDRQTAGRMLFLPVKCNLAGGVTGLAYRIVPSAGSEEVPVLEWEPGPVGMTAEEALDAAPHRRLTRSEQAAAWLESLLAAGPMACEEVGRRARAAGISRTALRRAKSDVWAQAYRDGFESPWMLRLAAEEEPGRSTAEAAEATVDWSAAAAGG